MLPMSVDIESLLPISSTLDLGDTYMVSTLTFKSVRVQDSSIKILCLYTKSMNVLSIYRK